MKNLKKILITLLLLFVISSSFVVFASEEFILTREMTYVNEKNYELENAFIEIWVGQKNFTEYQEDGDIVITPAPTEMREDEYGNLYAYYDVSGYKPGRTLNIKIQRTFTASTFEKEISVRSESSVTTDNELYIKEQTRVESEDNKIISKAKEITEGLSSDYKKALAIFEYVNTQMEYNTASTYANQGALSALESNKGVCEEFATLFAALCRAVDIPCKVIEGYRFEKNLVAESEIVFDNEIGEYVLTEPVYEYEIINHAWNELWLDDYGWLPVDTCVIYAPQGERLPYLDSFCTIKAEEYIATGVYNYDKANRTMKGIKETSFSESMILAEKAEEEEEHKFEDIGNYTWAEDSINTLYDMDIIKGYTETEFGPSGNISRIEFMVMLARTLQYMNYSVSDDGMVYYFMDYDKTHYSKAEYDYLMRCLEDEKPYDKFAKGYYAIYDIFGNRLNMNQPITRAEVVALLDVFLKDETNINNVFTDITYHKFRNSILKAYANGLIKGYGDGTFRPNGTITRAEIAVMLDRYVGVKEYVI